MFREILHGSLLGTVVGVLGAVIAFLIGYNVMIIQVTTQKDEINQLHKETINAVNTFNRKYDEKVKVSNRDFDEKVNVTNRDLDEKLSLFKSKLEEFNQKIPLFSIQYSDLISRIELIGQARVYSTHEVPPPASGLELQKIYTFLKGIGPRSNADKERLYDLALNGPSASIRAESLRVFMGSMDQKDWLAFVDLALFDGNAFLLGNTFSKDATPCDEGARTQTLVKVRVRLAKFYEENSTKRLSDDVKRGLRRFTRPGVCWGKQELAELVRLGEQYGDQEFVLDLNEWLSDLM